jgi:hypothetical protein
MITNRLPGILIFFCISSAYAASPSTDPSACPPAIQSSWKQENELNRQIASGNENSLRAGLLIMRCKDGGAAEDFDRSSGLFFDHNPKRFLEIIQSESVSDSRLKSRGEKKGWA